jgi:tetratricopeptide (TPR) repeat protein
MKSNILILVLFAFANSLMAQDKCYQTFYQKGIDAIKAEDFEAAINSFKAAKVCPDLPAENDLDDKILLAQNGFIIAIQKARDEAIAAKQEAEAANRALEAVTFISKGQEKELQKLFGQAIQFYTKAIEIFPDSCSYYEKRAPLYLNNNIREFEKAISDFAFLIKAGDRNKLPEYCDKIAYAYEQINQPVLARQYLFNANKYAPEVDKKIYTQKLSWFELRQEALENKGKNNQNPASFSIVYRESEYPDCSLNLKVSINGKVYKMRDNNFIINDLPAGEYNYQLSGKLNAYNSSIKIIGEGKLILVPNSVYFCIWKNKTDDKIGQYYQAWLSPY